MFNGYTVSLQECTVIYINIIIYISCIVHNIYAKYTATQMLYMIKFDSPLFILFCLDPHPSGTPNIFGQAVQVPTPSIIPTRPTRTTRTCSSLGCSQSCVLLSGVPTCVCRSGFQINRNGRTCDGKFISGQRRTQVLTSELSLRHGKEEVTQF